MKEFSVRRDRGSEPRWCFEWESEFDRVLRSVGREHENDPELPDYRPIIAMKPKSDARHFVGNEYFLG
jgi:hypothetical protein